ncbi:nucleotidyl transferase AbiEii/AbiGii toxin family protein [uncultured Brevundimonas sp.]|uniref:nucleotidyl transferase AbiEii/AbiGii toxin family protein n=1 Tax=uncultured Brevundimonas sp. TaxID=213418 RepID=UPI0030EE666F
MALLIRALPFVAEEPVFALKGGTAINLFMRDLPRLSVDIDLTYLPVEDRTTSLAAIDAAMLRIQARIEQGLRGVRVTPSRMQGDNIVTKLVVRLDGVQIKVEVTPVLRGTVYEPTLMSVTPAVEEAFGFAEISVVSFADLYAGKITAALDRQHPRDLFDVRDLLANEGVSDDLRSAFLIYVVSHPRPMAEILAPTRKNIDNEYSHGFDGMTKTSVSVEDLTKVREDIIRIMVTEMPESHRRFLVSFKCGVPDWALLSIPEAQNLPAVRWKQQNLDRLDADRRAALASKLEGILFPAT